MNNNQSKNPKYIVLHTEKSPTVTNMSEIKQGCKNFIQTINKCTKLKHLALILFFPVIFFLISGFIHKLPEQNYSGTLKSGSDQFFPLKNDSGKKDAFPSTGTINLNNRINEVYQQTPQLKQASIKNRMQNTNMPLLAKSLDSSPKALQSPTYMENSYSSENTKLTPYMTKDKYSSNTYTSYNNRKKAIEPYVNRYADKFGLDRDLVMSIIQVESNFMPHALSKDNAHGLMQIVPDMAAAEVNRFFKHQEDLSSLDLMHPENNIYYGTAYLYLLKRYHLNGIKNHDSMNSILIASYNAGSAAVLRHFGSSKEEAVAKINSMTAQEVYESLSQNYRSAETRAYLKRVTENLS